MRYSAFISYNHRDRHWATWLHRAFETYRVPNALWGRPAPWGEIGSRLPAVFRDRDELATSSDLAASVRAALEQAATLVVVCSPNSARSRWVNEEIKTFIALGRAHFVRLIIVDGEPHSPDPARECFPPALMEPGAPEPLAADVRAEADGKQGAKLKVLAGVLGVSYDELRQRETVRRQKRLMAFAAASSAGFIVMSGLAGWAVYERKLAEQRTVTAERTLDFVTGMFRVADPSEAQGQSITAREMVDRAAGKLAKSLDDEPTVKAELGVTLADVYGALGLYQDGDRLVRSTLKIHSVERQTQSRQYAALGESEARLGHYAAADERFRQAWKLSSRDSDALRSRILVGRGQALSALHRWKEADQQLNEALRIDLYRPGAADDVARDLEALGYNWFDAGKIAAAEPLISKALALRLRLEGPDSPSVSDNMNALANIAYRRGDLRRAEALYRRILPRDEKILGPDHPDLANTLNNLARTLIDERHFKEAGPFLERAIDISLKQRSDTHDDMTYFFTNLGIVRREQGRKPEARRLFEQGIKAARVNDHPNLGLALTEMAVLECQSGAASDGLRLLEEAAAITDRSFREPEGRWRSAWVQNVRGECLMRAGRTAEARSQFAASVPAIADHWREGTYYTVAARKRLGRINAQPS